MKDRDTSKAQALLDAARAELAAKRKVRETRFADTVLGWASEEEARDDSPKTVIGWDHPEARLDDKTAALMAALAELERERARRFLFILIGIILATVAGLFLAALF